MSNKVEILCIMDRSGSMNSIMDETVAAFNTFVKQQKELPGKARLTLVAFDHEYEVVIDRAKLKKVKKLSVADVEPRGMTALNDAIGRAVSSITADKVVCLIQTDGFENASQEYSTEQVKKLIDKKKEEGWDVSFIGAGIDAFSIGDDYGITSDKCLTVDKTREGMSTFSEYSSLTSTRFRKKHS